MPALLDDRKPYVAPTAGDSRSPCPALNSLANHGYIPHDGRNITLTQLIPAIRQVYGLSLPLATLFSVGGIAACGHRSGLQPVLDLHDLARHNVLEHDASLVHDDAPPHAEYAPTAVDSCLLHKLLSLSHTGNLSLADLCAAQAARKAASPPLNANQALVAKGELSLIHQVFGVAPPAKGESADPNEGHGGRADLVVPKEFLEEWLGRETLPEEWHGPLRSVGLTDLIADIRRVSADEKALSKTDAGSA